MSPKKLLVSKQTFGDKGQFSPLGWFVMEGDLDMCTALLACGAEVDEPTADTHVTPFRIACEEGHEHIALLGL